MEKLSLSSLESDVVLLGLESLKCPRAVAIAIMFRYGEYEQIVKMDFNPLNYLSIDTAREAFLATEALRKHADLPTNIDKDAVCIDAFYKSEERCRLTNDLFLSGKPLAHHDTLLRARGIIEKCLGDFCPFEFLDSSGWGPGSTLTLKRREASASNKFRNILECTPATFSFVKTWFASQFPNWEPVFRIYEGNKVITVPKSAKTNRVIAVEPSLNLFLQKGVGSMIRKRLKRYNIDLNDQGKNQKLAEIASLTGSLATIDFSAASDTIAYGLVEFLLPEKWFIVLDKLRSQRGLIDGKFVQYEKFSSMGNGYTFELESLIFFAIAKAFVPIDDENYQNISIFGDDLIAPSHLIEGLVSLFDECGFSINKAKSHYSGYYRESCGFHYWNGIRLCPFYFRSSLDSNVALVKLHNQMIRSHSAMFGYLLDGYGLTKPLKFLRNLLTRKKVPMVPPHFGDLGIIVPWDIAVPSVSPYGYGWNVSILSPGRRVKEEDDKAFLLGKLFELHLERDAVGAIRSNPKTGNEIVVSTDRVHVQKTWSPDWPCLVTYFSRN